MRFSKHTEAETFNRKELVKALAVHLGVRSVYNGMPTRSYTVGPYTIDWDGSIEGEDIVPLRDFLIEHDYAKAEDFEALYARIAEKLWEEAGGRSLVYAVPDALSDRSVDGIFERSVRFIDMWGTDVTERLTDNLRLALETTTPADLQRLAATHLAPSMMTVCRAGNL